MNFRKSESFHFNGEIRGVKCISEIQQHKNRKVQGSSTQWFYYFVSLGSERGQWVEKLGEMTGSGGTGWERHTWKPWMEKPFSKGLDLKGKEKERNTREGQHRVFVLAELPQSV